MISKEDKIIVLCTIASQIKCLFLIHTKWLLFLAPIQNVFVNLIYYYVINYSYIGTYYLKCLLNQTSDIQKYSG